MEAADLRALPLAAVGAVSGAFRYYVRPELTAKRGWALIAATVIAHEIFCPPGELLSEGADRLVDRHPLLTRAAGLMVASHVLNLVNEKADPIHQGLKLLKRF